MLDAHRLNDRRNFVHKRIFGAATGFLTGGVTGALSGAIRGGGGGGSQLPQLSQLQIDDEIRSGATSVRGLTRGQVVTRTRDLRLGGHLGGGGGGPCPGITNVRINGVCVDPFAALPGGRPFVSDVAGPAGPAGEAVMGRYGAALVPVAEERRHLDCLPGMVLGTDDLCYNRRDLKNSERKYPKGRAPLLTGGERNAITKAARAAAKIKRTEKQLQKLGMLKAPTRRPAPKAPAQRYLPAGTSIVNVE